MKITEGATFINGDEVKNIAFDEYGINIYLKNGQTINLNPEGNADGSAQLSINFEKGN
jgi:hypothetical protein